MEKDFLYLPAKHPDNKPFVLKEFPSGPKLWFDVLPQDILTRIVASLTLQSGDIPPVQLAELSPFFARAVIGLRQSRYVNFNAHNNDSWAVAFAYSGTTKHLDLCSGGYPHLSRAVHTSAIRMLASPLLQTAKIPDTLGLIKHALQSRTLRELAVRFMDYQKKDALPMFLRTVGSMSLRKLEILCTAWNRRDCIFKRMRYLEDEAGLKLARSCPHLIEFGSPCHCSFSCCDDEKCCHFWRIWDTLPNIRTATLRRDCVRGFRIESRVLDRLKALESVQVMNLLQEAALLGPVVTSVSDQLRMRIPFSPGDDSDIRALSKCVRVSDLRLLLRYGDDHDLRALNHAVYFMPALKYLSLRWEWCRQGMAYTKCRYIKTARNGDISECVAVIPIFHEETVESVMQLVRQTPVLESLELLDVRIPTEGVVDILRHLGNRLKHFGVSLDGQADSSFERLQMLIATICKYNCRLQSVASGLRRTEANDFSLQNVRGVHLSEANVRLLEERKGKLNEMLRSVSRCVPFLNATSLKSWLDDVSWIEVN